MVTCTVLITISLNGQSLVANDKPWDSNELLAAALNISMCVRKAGLSQGTTHVQGSTVKTAIRKLVGQQNVLKLNGLCENKRTQNR